MKTRTKLDAIDAVAARLSGRPWNSETCGDVAEILRSAGYTIRDLENEARDENDVRFVVQADVGHPPAGLHDLETAARVNATTDPHRRDLVRTATRRDHQELSVPVGDEHELLCEGCRRDETCLGGDCSSNACPSGARAE